MSAFALGLKSHSGWAALIAVDGSRSVIERRRIELVEPENTAWAKQPYHAAEKLAAEAARQLIARGIAARKLLQLGKSMGPPWGKDQKSAALAALSVLLG